jgi:hypothetical protein
MFRKSVLIPLHKLRLIEFDSEHGRARISPQGAKEVEEKLLKLRIPTKPARHSNLKPATRSDLKPAVVPI